MTKKGSLLTFFSFLITITTIAQNKVQWLDIASAFEAIKKQDYEFKRNMQPHGAIKKKVFVDVYTEWCGWCKVMDKNTFSNPEIAAYINKYFFPVKFDAETRDTIVIDKKKYVFQGYGRRGTHEIAMAIAANNGSIGYPTVVFLDENFNKIQALPGYLAPENALPILKFFAEDYYKTTSWEDFMRMYQENQK